MYDLHPQSDASSEKLTYPCCGAPFDPQTQGRLKLAGTDTWLCVKCYRATPQAAEHRQWLEQRAATGDRVAQQVLETRRAGISEAAEQRASAGAAA